MAYVGNTPADKTLKLEKQQFTTSATTSYTLDHSVSDPQDIALFINNVRQDPNSAYSVSGTALTISEATASTDTMYCVFLGRSIGTVGIGAGDVTKDKLNLISDSTAGLTVKGDGGSNDGYLQLNCRVNSHGIKLKSPPHSAGATYTLTFPNSVTADKFLKTDGSGNLSFASAGITEMDSWRITADVSGQTIPLTSNWERVDTYDWTKFGTGLSESSGVFSFPSTGYWLLLARQQITNAATRNFQCGLRLEWTNDNFSSVNYPMEPPSNVVAGYVQSHTMSYVFDVTNTTNDKFRFSFTTSDSNAVLQGNTSQSKTGFIIIRIGDT